MDDLNFKNTSYGVKNILINKIKCQRQMKNWQNILQKIEKMKILEKKFFNNMESYYKTFKQVQKMMGYQ